MSKFLKILAPAAGGTASVLTLAYVLADQFVRDVPAPLRGVVSVSAANAQTSTQESGDVAEQAAETATADAEPEDAPVDAVEIASGEDAAGHTGGFGLGRTALPEEVVAWDIDIRPDGMGLPAGSGDVWTGEEVYVEKCAVCHGDFGEAVGRWPVLAGGWDTLEREDPVKTIGSYWPYLSTVYDYIYRAMPFGDAQSLEPDEIYAITAYILYLNNVVEDDFELSNENFLEVEMPNADGFFMDDREDTELAQFSGEVCMENCKDSVEITMRAAILDVTPGSDEDETTESIAEASAEIEYADGDVTEEEMADGTDGAAEDAPEEVAADAEAAPEDSILAAVSTDPAVIDAGEGVYRACRACHAVGEGADNKVGPQLNGVVGNTIGAVDDFRYSNVFQEAHDAGDVWDVDTLSAFLANPRDAMPGTKMSYRGLQDEEDITAIIAYLVDASVE